MESITIVGEPRGETFWAPKDDITIYELAMALGILLPAAGGSWRNLAQEIESLPPAVRRHFIGPH